MVCVGPLAFFKAIDPLAHTQIFER
jgi:hypothetical protein